MSDLNEVLFEFTVQGNYVKVCAIDPKTQIEVTMVGDRRAGKEALQRLAIKKLEYVIDKKRGAGGASARDKNLY